MKKQKILITGANGFIGQVLCKQLLQQQQYSIHAVIRKNSHAILKQYRNHANFTYTEINDLQENINWPTMLKDVDTIIHLAAKVHCMQSQDLPGCDSYYNNNVIPTQTIATNAVTAGVRKMIYLSTSKVHGEKNTIQPFCEQDQNNPQDPYAISKYAAEKILRNIAANHALKVTIIRPPLVYGPLVRANFLSLMNIVYKKIPLPFKSIPNKRSLIYVKNLTDIIIKTISAKETDNKTYLVSDNEIASTGELINLLAKSMHHNQSLAVFNLAQVYY